MSEIPQVYSTLVSELPISSEGADVTPTHYVHPLLSVFEKIGTCWKILLEQAIGVSIHSTLPLVLGITKVDGN